jgi:hypothetical protein
MDGSEELEMRMEAACSSETSVSVYKTTGVTDAA